MDSNRLVRAYQSQELEFVVNQSIWNEGEVKFADVVLPACTNFERWGHRRMGRCRRLLAPQRVRKLKSPGNHDAAQVHRAAGGVQVRLPDLSGYL